MKNYIKAALMLIAFSTIWGCSSKDALWQENAKEYHRDQMTYCGTAGIQQRMEIDETVLILCKDNTFNMVDID